MGYTKKMETKRRFRIDTVSGLLTPAKICLSPNQDERPVADNISLLVIHNISLPPGQFGHCYIDDLFCNTLELTAHPYFEQLENLCVSSHLLIRRGGAVTQYVPFHKRAWHAGISEYQGKHCCNDFSIGIELEGTDDIPYTNQQYRVLSAVTDCLLTEYPGLSKSRIVGHSDIATGRKTDPGSAFDWALYRSRLTK